MPTGTPMGAHAVGVEKPAGGFFCACSDFVTRSEELLGNIQIYTRMAVGGGARAFIDES